MPKILIPALLIIILAVAGLFWYRSQTPLEYELAPVTTPTPSDSQTRELMQQSDSTEVDSIEADLNATDLDSLDAEIAF